MQFKDKKLWDEGIARNGNGKVDDYGGCVYFFSELWADLMEIELANGKKLEDIADAASHKADELLGQYGMTGFQYGCSVSILSKCWKDGEELRRWHNIKTQIGDEGEKANKSGGVLNPALLRIGK